MCVYLCVCGSAAAQTVGSILMKSIICSSNLYSVILTEYVAMEPRVCVCMYVYMCVCVCVTALQPKRMDGF